MIVVCAGCSSQNFISAERLAVGEIPPRCWKCGRSLAARAVSADPRGETAPESGGADPESNGGTNGK